MLGCHIGVYLCVYMNQQLLHTGGNLRGRGTATCTNCKLLNAFLRGGEGCVCFCMKGFERFCKGGCMVWPVCMDNNFFWLWRGSTLAELYVFRVEKALI